MLELTRHYAFIRYNKIIHTYNKYSVVKNTLSQNAVTKEPVEYSQKDNFSLKTHVHEFFSNSVRLSLS